MLFAIDTNETSTFALLAVVLFIVLVGGVYLIAGLFQARSLLRREFAAYFLSPIAYVVLVVFLAMTGHLFYHTMQQLTASGPKGVEFPMQLMFGDEKFWLVFLFIPPLLTMRLFAEERGTGTLEMLMTAPLRDWQVVLSKYLACFAFYVLLWLPTLAYLPILADLQEPIFRPNWTLTSLLFVGGLGAVVLALLLAWLPGGTRLRFATLVVLLTGAAAASVGGYLHYQGDEEKVFELPALIDPWPVFASYFGLLLAGAMFLALGLFVSSLVRNQMVAALVALAVSLLFIGAGFFLSELDTGSGYYRVISFFSVPIHFNRDFTRGLIDTRHLVLYGSVALCCLFLTVRSLERRRWQ